MRAVPRQPMPPRTRHLPPQDVARRLPPPERPRREPPPRRPEPPRSGPGRIGRAARSLAGVLTAGFVILVLFLIAVQIWATSWGQQGPGTAALISHVVAAAVAIVAQAIGEREADRRGDLATTAVYLAVIGSLWFWWW
ncbi:hypothetical protein GCM10009854_04810 [Saccharopolyspora halophila]|uniref:Uncharacterized protein n=1 Tax=Saccharopolyspora halophila TaxID=405551 RepID=A0ABN3FKW8_9PSEU